MWKDQSSHKTSQNVVCVIQHKTIGGLSHAHNIVLVHVYVYMYMYIMYKYMYMCIPTKCETERVCSIR